MSIQVDPWAVVLSGVASMIIGAIYYSKPLFGTEWAELAKINQKRFKKEMPLTMLGVFIAALITSYAVAYVSFLYHSYSRDSWLAASLVSALVLWLGVSATTLFIHNSLDQKRKMLTIIAMANRLLSFLAMGLIIGWLHP